MKPKAHHVAAAALATFTGAVIYGQVNSTDTLTRVIDGDTIIVNGSTRVRLFGIDAPELGQPCTKANGMIWDCGAAAKKYLESFFMLKNVTVKCDKKSQDNYGRSVRQCFVINADGQRHDIAKSLVASGYAVDYRHFSNGAYADDESYARQHHLGIWSGQFEMPWTYRHEQGGVK